MFRNKRIQAKGVYYVFLYEQYMDIGQCIYMGSFPQVPTWPTSGGLIPLFSSSVRNLPTGLGALTLWLPDAEPIFSSPTLLLGQVPALSLSPSPLGW